MLSFKPIVPLHTDHTPFLSINTIMVKFDKSFSSIGGIFAPEPQK